MDVSSTANTASTMQQGSLARQVSVAVLKQALEVEANASLQLISTIPIPASHLPSNLGQNLNISV